MYYRKYSLDLFAQVPTPIVFAVEDAINKIVYVNETGNGLWGVARLIRMNPELNIGTLVVHIIENDAMLRKHYAGVIIDKYVSDGWKVLNSKKPLVFCKCKLVHRSGKFQVILVTVRRNEKLVGEFDSYDEAKAFYESYYKKEMPYPIVIKDRL